MSYNPKYKLKGKVASRYIPGQSKVIAEQGIRQPIQEQPDTANWYKGIEIKPKFESSKSESYSRGVDKDIPLKETANETKPYVSDARTVIENGQMKQVPVFTTTPQRKLSLEDYSSEFDNKGNIVIPEKRIDKSIANKVNTAVYNSLNATGIDPTSGMGTVLTSVMGPIFTGLEQMQRGNKEKEFGREITDNILGLATIGIGSIPAMVGVNSLIPAITEFSGNIAENLGMSKETGEKIGHLISFAPFGSKVILAGLTSTTAGDFVAKLLEDKDISETDKERIIETAHHIGFFGGLGTIGLTKNVYRNLKTRADINSLSPEKLTPQRLQNAISEEIQKDNQRQVIQTLEKDRQTAQMQFEKAQTPEERLKALNTIEKIDVKKKEYSKRVKVSGNQQTRRETLEIPESKNIEQITQEFEKAKTDNQSFPLIKDTDIDGIIGIGDLNNLNYLISQHNVNLAKQTGNHSLITPEYVNTGFKNIKGQIDKLGVKTKPVETITIEQKPESVNKEILKEKTAEELFELPETKIRLRNIDIDAETIRKEFHAKTKNYKDNTYYHVETKNGESGVGEGLYLGKDKEALQKFYDIGQEGYEVKTYKGDFKFLDLTDYDKFDKFEKEAKNKYPNEESGNEIKKLAIEKGYDGIRYYDPEATGEEFVLYNLKKLTEQNKSLESKIINKEETKTLENKEDTKPETSSQKYRIGRSPMTYSLVERLPFNAKTDLPDEKYVKIKNDKTGEVFVSMESDLKPVKQSEPVDANQHKIDLIDKKIKAIEKKSKGNVIAEDEARIIINKLKTKREQLTEKIEPIEEQKTELIKEVNPEVKEDIKTEMEQIKKSTELISNIENVLIENPRSEIPKVISEKIKSDAENKLEEIKDAEIVRQGSINTIDPITGESKGTSPFTISGFPKWFSELGQNKKSVINALNKIIEDKGKDKGVMVEKVKAKILEHLAEGKQDSRTYVIGGEKKISKGDFTPPDKDVTDFLEQFKKGTITKKDLQKWEREQLRNERKQQIEEAKLYREEEKNKAIAEKEGLWDIEYEQAKKTLKEAKKGNTNFSMLGTGKLDKILQPEVFKAVYTIGKYHYENGAKALKDFSRKIIEEVGDWIKPHLKGLYDKLKGESDLIARHNLYSDRLKFADEIGGIANPSLAITKRGLPFEKFGNITLVADKKMINPYYRKAKVFGADVYSPRYPLINAEYDYKKLRELNEKVYESSIKYRENPNVSKSSILDNTIFKEYNKEGLHRNIDFQIYYLDKISKDNTKGIDYNDYPQVREAINKDDVNYRKYIDGVFADITKDKKIFKGYTYLGNKRYIPLTLENLSKELKSNLRGGENFNYGAGSLRAKFTPEFKKINDIVKAKDKLINPEKFDEIKRNIDDELFEVIDTFEYGNKDRYRADSFIDIISDAVRTKRSIVSELNEFGFKNGDNQKLFEFLAKLKELPTEYFESIITRPVKLNEFKLALVPNDVSTEVLNILEKNGINDIRKYKDSAERQNIINNLNEYSFGEEIPYEKYLKAKKSLQEKLNRANMTFGLDTLPELYTIGKYHLTNGVGKFTSWASKMIKDFGNKIKPHLRNLWDEITKDRTELENVVMQGISPKNRKTIISENLQKVSEPKVKSAKDLSVTDKKTILASDIFTKGSSKAKEDVFNYGNFTESEQINKMIQQSAKDNKPLIDEQKRDIRSWVKTQEASDMLRAMGWNEKALLNTVKGDSFLTEKILASKDIVHIAGKELLKAMKELPEGVDAKVELADKFLKYNALVTNLKGLISESGRALNIARMKSAEDVKVKIELADELIKLGLNPNDITGLNKALEIIQPTFRDKFYYWWYNSMLSNPLTDVANITGNLSHLGFELFRTAVTEKPATAIQIMKDLRKSHFSGVEEVKKIFKLQETADSKFDYNERKYAESFNPVSKIGKRIKSVLPTTRLSMEDAYFRNLFGALRKHKTLQEISKETNEPVNVVEKLINDVYQNPDLKKLDEKFEIYDKHLKALERFIDYGVFQAPLGKGGSHIQKGLNKIPLLKAIMPFMKIAVNLTKTGIRITPYGLKDLITKKDITSLEKKDIVTRALLGTTFFGGLAYLMANDLIEITGHGVDDKDKRELWYKQGYKENHFYIKVNGEKYGFSYTNINPVNTVLSLIGSYSDDLKYNQTLKDDEKTFSDKFLKAVLGMVEVLTTQSFMQGIGQTVNMIRTNDPEGIKRSLQNLVLPSGLSFPKDIYNYYRGEKPMYETKTFSDRLKNKIGMTEDLKPALNQFGEHKSATFERFPLPVSELKPDDELTKFLTENDIEISYPSKSTKLNDFQMTPEQYYEYNRIGGAMIKETLLSKLNILKTLKTKEEKSEAVKMLVDEAREETREIMTGKKTKEQIEKEKNTKKYKKTEREKLKEKIELEGSDIQKKKLKSLSGQDKSIRNSNNKQMKKLKSLTK